MKTFKAYVTAQKKRATQAKKRCKDSLKELKRLEAKMKADWRQAVAAEKQATATLKELNKKK